MDPTYRQASRFYFEPAHREPMAHREPARMAHELPRPPSFAREFVALIAGLAFIVFVIFVWAPS